MLQRIEALKNRQQSSVESGLSNLSAYGLRRKPDFDKYAALALAEDLVVVAQNSKHEKATFLSAATRALRDRLEKPVEQFQAYFMALFSDKDYSKVLVLSRKWIKPFGQPPRQPPTPLPRRHVLALRTPV